MSNYYHETKEATLPKHGEAKRLLIFALSLSVVLPLLIVICAVAFKNLGMKSEVESLEAAIKSVNTDLIEKDDCDKGVQGYYQFEKIDNDVVADQVVVCTNNFSKTLDNYPALLKHEMTHIMHACLNTTINSPDEVRELRKELREHSESSYRTIHSSYQEKDHFEEVEARWMELQDYKFVNNQLQKHCRRG